MISIEAELETVAVIPRPWEKLFYRPESWFEPLPIGRMFDVPGPLEVELGSGDGSFLVAWAGMHPERRFIGVERLLGRISKIDRKGQRAGLANLRTLRIEAGYCMEYLLPAAGVQAVHVYFPDPWPKRRHHKNRLVQDRFVELAARVLVPGGKVHFRTDDEEYFRQITGIFDAARERFTPVPTPPELLAVKTDFERGFHAKGIPTLEVSYRKA